MKNAWLIFRADEDLRVQLKKLAKEEGRSVSNLISHVLTQYIHDQQK